MQPRRSNFVSARLTQYSFAYSQEADRQMAGRIFTALPVDTQFGTFAKYPKGFFLKSAMSVRPLGQEAKEVTMDMEEATYKAEEYSEQMVVDRRMRAQGLNNEQTDQAITEMLTDHAHIYQENQWASKFFKTGVWGTDLEGVAANPAAGQFLQFDQTDPDTIRTVRAFAQQMKRSTGKRPNTLVVGSDVWEVWMADPQIQELYKYVRAGLVSMDELAQVLGIPRIFMPENIHAIGNFKGNGDLPTDFIVDPKSMWMGFVAPKPAPLVPTAGIFFPWRGLLGAQANDDGIVVEKWEDIARASEIQRVTGAWGMEVIAPDLGVFFENAVS